MKHILITGVAGTTSSQKAFKAVALLLAFCIADVYVRAGNRVTNSDVARDIASKPSSSARDTATNIAASKLLLGRLVVPYHREILVNGQGAISGDIIISGSHVQNPRAGIPATVDIGSIARLDIEPDTDLLLTFDQKSVEVKVASGNATLITSDGVKGEVVMPDGKVYASTPAPDNQCEDTPFTQPVIGFFVILGIAVAVTVVDSAGAPCTVSPISLCV